MGGKIENVFRGRHTGYVKELVASGEGFANPVEMWGDPEKDNVVTSMAEWSTKWHYPVIDLDLPAYLEPSSTPGHFHLYLEHAMSLENYIKLLTVMVEVGLVQEGYLQAVKARGYGTLRLPWVFKEGANDSLPDLVDRLLS